MNTHFISLPFRNGKIVPTTYLRNTRRTLEKKEC